MLKCSFIVQLVSTIDSQVAETVSQNKDEFYDLNKWSRPSIVESAIESWYVSAKEWIKNAAKTVADNFTHSFDVYNETDFSELSDEELQEYYDKMVELLESGDLCTDDEIRLKALMDYLSGTEINQEMSNGDRTRVDMYIHLYESMKENTKDKDAINTFFTNSAYSKDGSMKSGVNEEDIANIKFFAYKSEGDVHKLFFDNISKCIIMSWDNTDGSYYHFNYDGTKETGIYFMNKHGEYGTFFHEIGHNIDDLMYGKLDGEFYSAQSFEFGTLHEAMVCDVEKTVTSVIEHYSDTEMKLSD